MLCFFVVVFIFFYTCIPIVNRNPRRPFGEAKETFIHIWFANQAYVAFDIDQKYIRKGWSRAEFLKAKTTESLPLRELVQESSETAGMCKQDGDWSGLWGISSFCQLLVSM